MRPSVVYLSDVRILALIKFSKMLVRQQFCKSDDGSERRSQLMTHVSEKTVLGRFCRVRDLQKIFHILFAFGFEALKFGF